jgi:hypothetical protein
MSSNDASLAGGCRYTLERTAASCPEERSHRVTVSTNASTIMIAEKTADIIKAAQR